MTPRALLVYLDFIVMIKENALNEDKTLGGALSYAPPWRAPGRRFFTRAAVAVVFCNALNDDWRQSAGVLFVKRASRKGDPWSGHMAFPGGRSGSADADGQATAIREAQEETGLDLEAHARILGRLSDIVTRTHERFSPMVVTPYVFGLNSGSGSVSKNINVNHELERTLWIPFSHFLEPENRIRMEYRAAGVNWRLPCYEYEGECIWGLSLMIVDDLLGLMKGRPASFLKRATVNLPDLPFWNRGERVYKYR